MIFDNPYALIDFYKPGLLAGLPADAKDVLRCCMDWTGLVLVLLTGCVKTLDGISGEVLASETIGDFLDQSIEYALNEMEA